MSRHFTLGIALASYALNTYAAASSRVRDPSAQDWAALNKTVGGRLGVGVPWSLPCFSLYNGRSVTPDAAQCQFVQANYVNSHVPRTDSFGSTSATQWETCMSTGDSCELNFADTSDKTAFVLPAQCKQGSIPDYFIDVKNQDDVIAGLKFAQKTGIPLVVKNTGHDYQGRSTGKGALALWTHHLKQLSYNKQFRPEGCPPATPPSSVVTVGAGAQFDEIFKFADANNVIVVGGSDQSVGGGGGWIMGGGHSILSPSYGMGVDRVVQFKVVTPDGVSRVANACQNQDLFFALRGGGGGTFGVLLETAMVASPRTSFRVANINWEINDANYAAVLKVFIDNATTFAQQGWGGYITPSLGNAIFITPKLDQQAAQASMKALLDVTANMGKSSTVTQADTFLQWFQGLVQGTSGFQDSVGLPSILGSRLIPQKNLATAESRAQLLNATLAGTKAVVFSQIHFTTPFGFTGKTDSVSITPAWRTSLWQNLFINVWPYDASLSVKQQAFAGLTGAINLIRQITPDSGAYHNEADIHEPNHEVSFWGSNYPKLVQIKNKYDPDHILDCWHCVGSRGEKDPRFSCYI